MDRLRSLLNGRFRLRWSDARQEFHLEQKVATGQIIPPPTDQDDRFDTYDDDWIRARDGYMLTMRVRSGDRMPCPSCHRDVPVPIRETRELRCIHCGARYKAAFFPDLDALETHLRYIDPLTDGPKRVRDRMRASQLSRQERQQLNARREGEEHLLDDKIQAFGVPMVGYGEKHTPASIG